MVSTTVDVVQKIGKIIGGIVPVYMVEEGEIIVRARFRFFRLGVCTAVSASGFFCFGKTSP